MVSLTCVKFPCKLWCLLNFPDVSLLSVHDHDVNSQIKQKQKYMPLTKVDISSRNKVDIENHYPCFSVLQLKKSCDKRMFIFTINFFFLFPFLVCVKWACIKRQCNLICNCQNSTFHSSNLFSSKGEGNLVTIMVGGLTWIGVVTINWPAQAKFLF